MVEESQKDETKEKNNESNITAPNIHILGDFHYDIFKLGEQESKPKKGGIFFVENILKSKPDFIRIFNTYNPIKIDYIKTIRKKPSESSEEKMINLGPVYSFKWECQHKKLKDIHVLRTKIQTSLIKTIINETDVENFEYAYFDYNFLLETLKKIKIKLESNCNNFLNEYFLLECHENINNNENNYNALFFNKDSCKKIIEQFNDLPKSPDKNIEKLGIPCFFWIIHQNLPPFMENGSYFEDEEIKISTEFIKSRSILFLNGNALRDNGIHIRKHLSWESLAQDYVGALYSHPKLSGLKNYRHIITRFGITGAIYSYHLGTSRWMHRLIFDPKAPNMGTFRDSLVDGEVVGYHSIYATCVLTQVIDYISKYDEFGVESAELTEIICDGIRKAIVSCQELYNKGIVAIDLKQEEESEKEINKSLINEIDKSSIENFRTKLQCAFDMSTNQIKIKSAKNICKLVSPREYERIANERIPVANSAWSILVQSADYNLFEKAENLVFFGVNEAFNNPYEIETSWAPLIRFGNKDELIVIDRREIESYRSISSLLSRTINEGADKPLSIAVFGPPGSGKSFTVKRLVESAGTGKHKAGFETINLTQVKDTNDLTDNLLKFCAKQYTDEKVPVIFFDEFDTNDLQWLKVFLSPMEDMSARDLIEKLNNHLKTTVRKSYQNKENDSITDELDKQQKKLESLIDLYTKNEADKKEIKDKIKNINLPNSNNFQNSINELIKLKSDLELKYEKLIIEKSPIFVFAGGTSHNYQDFCHDDNTWTEQEKFNFKMAKGPDFVSRLKGHINILGPNPLNDYDDGYVIRRAILLRSMLIERLESVIKEDQDKENFDLTDYIFPPIVKAILRVSSFKHGARSMRAIISMSELLSRQERGKLVSSTLPTLEQLNMHVNGKEFLDMIINESKNFSATKRIY